MIKIMLLGVGIIRIPKNTQLLVLLKVQQVFNQDVAQMVQLKEHSVLWDIR